MSLSYLMKWISSRVFLSKSHLKRKIQTCVHQTDLGTKKDGTHFEKGILNSVWQTLLSNLAEVSSTFKLSKLMKLGQALQKKMSTISLDITILFWPRSRQRSREERKSLTQLWFRPDRALQLRAFVLCANDWLLKIDDSIMMTMLAHWYHWQEGCKSSCKGSPHLPIVQFFWGWWYKGSRQKTKRSSYGLTVFFWRLP